MNKELLFFVKDHFMLRLNTVKNWFLGLTRTTRLALIPPAVTVSLIHITFLVNVVGAVIFLFTLFVVTEAMLLDTNKGE